MYLCVLVNFTLVISYFLPFLLSREGASQTRCNNNGTFFNASKLLPDELPAIVYSLIFFAVLNTWYFRIFSGEQVDPRARARIQTAMYPVSPWVKPLVREALGFNKRVKIK